MILLSKIIEARKRLNGVIDKTPFAYAPLLSEQINTKVYLKKENLQITGAYKIRGAYNKIASLSEKERKKGVIAASAGNHAQGVALASEYFGIPATIVMPETTPLTKIDGVKSYGAEVVLEGKNYDESCIKAQEIAKTTGA